MRYELLRMYTLMTVYVNYTVLSNSQTNPYNFGFKGKEDVVCLGILRCKEELPSDSGKGRAHMMFVMSHGTKTTACDMIPLMAAL